MIILDSYKEYEIVPLSEMLKVHGLDIVSGVLGSFKSVYDSATESYLKEKAIDMEVRDLSRTYLAVSEEDLSVLGYITISVKCMRVPDENLLSGKTKKSMNIDSRTNIVQSFLIGQLSRSVKAPKGLGGDLLDTAFDKLNQAKSIVGCRIVRLDCHDELIPYYESHGFKLITKSDDGRLNQMMAFITAKHNGNPDEGNMSVREF